MRLTIFKSSMLAFVFIMALVVGGACYQAVSIVPFWQKDISMFTNYSHWGANYFPVLTPLMTILWLIVLISGWAVHMPHKGILNIAHAFFLLIIITTAVYFVPFLATYMGRPNATITNTALAQKLAVWAKWDLVRQIIGLIPLFLFIYSYGNIGFARINNKGS
ncbi:MAG: hypothetical protein ICV66_09875 [Chitinophagaceae bacterium]|nr:hypothetical protein [Chitinophagaceae bacterium]